MRRYHWHFQRGSHEVEDVVVQLNGVRKAAKIAIDDQKQVKVLNYLLLMIPQSLLIRLGSIVVNI